MSFTTVEPTSTLTSEAYDLINSFYNGIDDVVYQVAEHIARSRHGGTTEAVRIEADDVREAGWQVIEALRHVPGFRDIPAELQDAIEGMGECMNSK